MGSGRTTHASPEVRHRDSRKIRKDRWILSHPGEVCLRCWDRKWSHIRRHRHQHMTHPSSRGTGLKTPQPSYSAAKKILSNLLNQWLCSYFSSLKVHLLFHVWEDFFFIFFFIKVWHFSKLLKSVYIIQTYLNPTVDLTSRLQNIQWFVPKFENCRDEFKRCLKVVWNICR